MDISIVVPVYNGELALSELSQRIAAFFEKEKSLKYEIVFVFDCGNINSWEKIKEIKIKYPDIVKAIKLTKNFGQHNAIICGFKYASGRLIITMDEDLQHDPEDIKNLLIEHEKNDYDVVYGKYTEQRHNFFRNLTSNLLRLLLRVGIPNLHADYSPFRLIKNSIAKETISMNNSYTFLDGYLSWITTNVSSTKISHKNRPLGESSYTLKILINHSINIFITFSNLPIRLVTYSSFVIFGISIVYSLYLVMRKIIFNDIIPGYTSMMILLGMGIGMIIFSLGIIGEYIYRINLKTTKKPDHIVDEII